MNQSITLAYTMLLVLRMKLKTLHTQGPHSTEALAPVFCIFQSNRLEEHRKFKHSPSLGFSQL